MRVCWRVVFAITKSKAISFIDKQVFETRTCVICFELSRLIHESASK